ncbi:MCE family protein, partial [Streptomyces sp. SID11233]|nr:MCE family protein [Streptomyces sp. SID11233]
STRRRFLVGGLVLVLLTAAGVYGIRAARPGGTRVTAYFDRAVGMYEGSDLRILGVRVGRVVAVRPQG